jgi:predicted ATPase
MGHRLVGAAAMFHGEHSVGRIHTEQALAEFDPDKHASLASGYGQDLGAAILSYLTLSLCLLGYPDQAVVRGREALARARAVEHANTLAYTLWHVGTLLWWLLDDSDELSRATEEILAVAAEPRLPIWIAAAKPFGGEVSRRSGKADSGLAEIEEGLAMTTELRFGLSQPASQLMRGQSLHDLGRTDEALQAIAKGLAQAKKRAEHWIEPELLRFRGELLLHQGNSADAETSFQAAIALAEKQGAKWWKLRAATSLARVWLDQGRRDDARDLLAPVYNWFTEGFDTRSIKAAKELLDELA